MPPSVPSLPRRVAHMLRTSLFAQVACALVLGIVVGKLWPGFGADLQPLGDGFIRLIKTIISPLVFCVVVVGIAKAGDLKAFGRIGLKALIWFEVASTLALVIGLLAANVVQPGSGMNVDPATLDASAVDAKTGGGHLPSTTEFVLEAVPTSFIGAFAENSLLQVLVLACLVGAALLHLGHTKVPQVLPRFVVMPDGERFVPLEQVIAAHLDQLLPGMIVEEHFAFRVTPNADLTLEEEEAHDLLAAVEIELRRRRFGRAVRIEIDRDATEEVRTLLLRELDLDEESVYDQTGTVNFIDVSVDRGTDTIHARASMPNPNGALVDNQLVRVVVEIGAVITTVSTLATDGITRVTSRCVMTNRASGYTRFSDSMLSRCAGVFTRQRDGGRCHCSSLSTRW